ncbi:hypothetical protein J5690_10095 [bacterium]|nr:hypothetical protein [bacterium]
MMMFKKTSLKKGFSGITALLLSVLLISCDIFNDCSSSNAYSTRCNGLSVEKCVHNGDGYNWEEYRNCINGCPSEIGNPSCAASTCSCSVQSQYVCEKGNSYRCSGDSVEKCTSLEHYNGYIWEHVKNCASMFPESEVIESGSCYSTSDYYEPKCVPKIKKAFRGKWLRLSDSSDFYLGTNGITKGYYNSTFLPKSITKIDDNMLEITTEDETFRLIRNSITDATLKLNVKRAESFTKSPSGSGVGGIDVILENTQDSGETYEKQSGSDGKTEFDGIVSGEYTISVGNTSVTQNISDHLNAGNFYFSPNGYIYKALLNATDEVYYAEDTENSENGNNYTVYLRIYNLGDRDASATTISLKTDDKSVILAAEDKILGTIEPEHYVSYRFSIETIPFSKTDTLKNEVYHDVEFLVSLKDINGEIWEDVVTLRIFRKAVPIYLYSTMSNPFILLSPHREIVSMSNVVWVPYRPDAKYKLIAQSLTLNTEGVYSIGVGSWDRDKWNSDRETFTDVSNYEPNNQESQAKTISMNSQTTSYLHKNDIDFWIIDMGK